jgi:hypothetical protein
MLEASAAEAFDRTGILKVEHAFSDTDAARMRDVVWHELGRRYGIAHDDPSTWNRHEPTGLTSTKKSPAFAPMCGPVISEALDALFGAGRWQPPKSFGNVLVTMPSPGPWRVPHKVWHSDFQPTLPADHLVAVKLWVLFDDVDAGGGGTPQLAGSHALFARYVARTGERDYKRAKFGFLGSDPWLKGLCRDDGDPARNETLMGAPTEIDGQGLRVVECTGRAGDVYVTHPWVFHSIAPNTSTRPRLMRSFAVIGHPCSLGSARSGRLWR